MKRMSTQKTFEKKSPPFVKHFPFLSKRHLFKCLSPELLKLWPSNIKYPRLEKVTPLGSWELEVPERWIIGMDGMDGMLQSSDRLESDWIVVWPHFGSSFCWVTLEDSHHFHQFHHHLSLLLLKQKELLSLFRQLSFFGGGVSSFIDLLIRNFRLPKKKKRSLILACFPKMFP